MSDYSRFESLGGVHPFAGVNYQWSVYQRGQPVMQCEEDMVGSDTETTLIMNRHTLPDGVLAGFCSGSKCHLVWWEDWSDYIPRFIAANPHVKWAFFNGAFDMDVMGEEYFVPLLNLENKIMEISAAYATYKTAERGWFAPGYTLDSVTVETLGVALNKDDSIRLTYKRDMPVVSLGHCIYLVEDCAATLRNGKAYNNQPTESIQARASYVFSRISRNGMLVDKDYLKYRHNIVQEALKKNKQQLKLFNYKAKEDTDKLKTIPEKTAYIFDKFGLDIKPVFAVNNIKAPPKWWIKSLFVVLYTVLHEQALPTEIIDVLKSAGQALACAGIPKKVKEYSSAVDEMLSDIMKSLDCEEFLTGLGDAKPAAGTGPYMELILALVKLYDEGEHLKGASVVEETIKELMEDNFCYLSNAPKKMSPTQFVQEHVKKLMRDNPGLELPLTKGSIDNIKKAKADEVVKARAEKRKPNPIDVSQYASYTVTKGDAWRYEDVGVSDPFLELYFEYKHNEKLLSTYLTDKYIDTDGRVHTRLGTAVTSRSTSSSPNI